MELLFAVTNDSSFFIMYLLNIKDPLLRVFFDANFNMLQFLNNYIDKTKEALSPFYYYLSSVVNSLIHQHI